MINKCPVISIIIPIYNAEKYLRKCLDSLIRQTFTDIEIICVDDESTDNSGRILEEYAKNDHRIVVVSQKNTGASGARNTGMKISRGKYIMFVDSDDWLDLETCETAYRIAKDYMADVVMWSYVREYQEQSKPKVIFTENLIEFDKEEVKEKLFRFYLGPLGKELSKPENMESLNPVCMKLYKTSLIKENNIELYDIKKIGTGEDGLFNLQLFKYVEKAVFINKYFYHYRKSNTESITTKYNTEKYHQWQHLFDVMETYIMQQNLDNIHHTALNNRIALSIIGLGLNILDSDKSGIAKVREIKKILSTGRYRKAYRQLPIRYFPIHWALFFTFAKLNFATGIYTLLSFMKKAM
ncbi:glycosyltransferase family 2 protein [Cytobacillus sp. NCCP-133]|uniref:glycosyltransferase family 2 protein n=1 Tax=Cytobacillus sp. NCCP-133 TaxID=766848 RepID=UPI00222FD71B|nr:glycosyltransferase family 2 protein [Cytobacillus sp. NCCP-133]GLB58983.1 hypothetical protein NCCP133_11160 [Cytobacillus sp. NCCP-133]